MSTTSAYDPDLTGAAVSIPGQRLKPEAAHAATLQHCQLIRAKLDMLNERLAEAMAQLYVSADREYKDGLLDMADLADLYVSAKALAPGFTTLWNQHMSVSAGSVQSFIVRRSINTPNAGDGLFWQGPYPYDYAKTPRPPYGTAVVYVLYDATNEPIYVGSSGSFGARLRRHYREGKTFVWWLAYPCESREAAYLLEDGLLAARKLRFNKRAGR